ncbi:MAG: hypothetical protein H6677_08950 [Candidatus Obscuribacterales bacterium]|nr:hypothetical protein [Candidatus Obscuribacterales bacterium]
MSDQDIKTGDQIVQDFVDSLCFDSVEENAIADAIRSLLQSGKLTRTNLLQQMASLREQVLADRGAEQ